MIHTSRRALLQAGMAAAAVQALPVIGRAQTATSADAQPHFEPQLSPWRTFEVTTTVTVPQANGVTQVWLPAPNLDTDFQRTLDNSWSGDASSIRLEPAPKGGAAMLHAEFPSDGPAPTVTFTSRVQTRNRVVDWSKPGKPHEDPAVLRAALQPTDLQPVDGIVRTTALAATQGASTDVEKVRAIYNWVVGNCHREPSVPGCGTGAIKAMLESGNLAGKCADLSALFAAMCRSVGVPAREIYGVRVAPSAFGYQQLGGNPANLSGAQHCRAEVWLSRYGWVAMDPADVLKVMRQEKPEWIKDLNNPLIAPVNKALFGSWEGNWVGFNTVNDVTLPGSGASATLPFLMYPQGQNSAGRFNELSASAFKYAITAKELTA
ncbi:MAG TPA: transglutaminase domain-containing protein [Caulobacteraceae bacterium]|nr:transglutaminase domain-containing protein [Caulobacteraceae bacterium]